MVDEFSREAVSLDYGSKVHWQQPRRSPQHPAATGFVTGQHRFFDDAYTKTRAAQGDRGRRTGWSGADNRNIKLNNSRSRTRGERWAGRRYSHSAVVEDWRSRCQRKLSCDPVERIEPFVLFCYNLEALLRISITMPDLGIRASG